LFVFAVYAAYMHTKSSLGAVIVAVFIAPPLAILLPEARWIAFLALVFGVASVLWEFSRKYVMSR
jgi:ABC-type proline/glycine betaine transport system permease subunit